MVPPPPKATKVLPPYVTSLRGWTVPELRSSQAVPSEEVKRTPDSPTATNIPFPYEIRRE